MQLGSTRGWFILLLRLPLGAVFASPLHTPTERAAAPIAVCPCITMLLLLLLLPTTPHSEFPLCSSHLLDDCQLAGSLLHLVMLQNTTQHRQQH
jgi:hypothetical protein